MRALPARSESPSRLGRLVMVLSVGLVGSSGGSGEAGQPIALLMPSNTGRTVPSTLRHSASKHRRKTPPSIDSKEKKFGRRYSFERWSYFFSSASEYWPKKRTASAVLLSRNRLTST